LRRVDQQVARAHAHAYRQLVAGRAALRRGQDLVDARVHDGAGVDAEEAVEVARGIAEFAVHAPNREARVVAVAIGRRRGQRRLDGCRGEAGCGQVGGHVVALVGELALVGDVLPLAAAAGPKVGAGRRDAVRGRP